MNFRLLADYPQAVPTVAEWYFNAWGQQLEGNSVEKTCERILGKLNRDRPPLHVLAMEGEQVFGVAQLKVREMDIYPQREHWLGGVFVSPAARGKGIASKLALHVVEIARSFGVAVLYLQTERLDGGLYARLGWKPLEQVCNHGIQVLVMEKQLGEGNLTPHESSEAKTRSPCRPLT